ncbi:hypothetical protein R4L75_06035 [Brachyspira pilosicoli]|uniref:DUF2441 domain-containing protein n=1 Tax=Brachyspira pilosicoli TaxID=52584 RepID=UPI0030079F2B
MCNQKEYFRVINYDVDNYQNNIVDTENINYGKITLPLYREYEPFGKKILELEDKYKYDYNIEIYVLLLEMLYKRKKNIEKDVEIDEEFLKKLLIDLKFDEKDIERDFVYIYRIAGTNYGEKYIEFDKLLTIAKNFLPFIYLLELPISKTSRLNNIDMLCLYLGEIILEEERKLNFSKLPSRLGSFFLFKDIETAKKYKNMHDGHIIKIIPQIITNYFEGDMHILDSIKYHRWYYKKSHTISQLKKIFYKYWSGEKTSTPIIEILFQGKCKIQNKL